jgi:hypothetical protein
MINLNPAALNVRELIKIHKPEQPIRPVVNRRNAPTRKLAKFLPDILKRHITLPNAYNVKNTQLIMDLKLIEINPNSVLTSFDISSMYTNIPTRYLRSIIEKSIMTNLNETCRTQQVQEILTIYDLVTKQNYFSHNDIFWQQKEGLAMGAPSSAILSEIFYST